MHASSLMLALAGPLILWRRRLRQHANAEQQHCCWEYPNLHLLLLRATPFRAPWNCRRASRRFQNVWATSSNFSELLCSCLAIQISAVRVPGISVGEFVPGTYLSYL